MPSPSSAQRPYYKAPPFPVLHAPNNSNFKVAYTTSLGSIKELSGRISQNSNSSTFHITEEMDFHSLKRRDLQTLCKKNKIPANMTNVAMADALQSLEFVEGLEEFLKQSESETLDSPEKLGTNSSVPRTSTRRKTTKEEPESSKLTTRSRRGTETRRIIVEETIDDQENRDVSESPVVAQSTRRKAPVGGSTRKKIETETPQTRGKSEVRAHMYSTRRSARILETKMSELSLEESEEKPSGVKRNEMGNNFETEYSTNYLKKQYPGAESKSINETEASEASYQSVDALLENKKGHEREDNNESEHDEVGMKAELEVAASILEEINVDEIVGAFNGKQCKGDKMQEMSDNDIIGHKMQEMSEVVDEVDQVDDNVSNDDPKEEVQNKKGFEQLPVILSPVNAENLTEKFASKSKLDTEVTEDSRVEILITLMSSDISVGDDGSIASKCPKKPDNCSDLETDEDDTSADQDKDQEEEQSRIGETESKVTCELSRKASSQVLQSDIVDEDPYNDQSDCSESTLEVACVLKRKVVSSEAQQHDNVDKELEKFQSEINGPAVIEDMCVEDSYIADIPVDEAAQSFGKQIQCGGPYKQAEVNGASVDGNLAEEGTTMSMVKALYCLTTDDAQWSGCVDSIMEFGDGMGTKYSDTAPIHFDAVAEIVTVVATAPASPPQSTEKASDGGDFGQTQASGSSGNIEKETSSMSSAEFALSLNDTVSDDFENHVDADGGVEYPNDNKFVDQLVAVDTQVDNEVIPGDLAAGHVDVGYADFDSKKTENNSPYSCPDDQGKLYDSEACLDFIEVASTELDSTPKSRTFFKHRVQDFEVNGTNGTSASAAAKTLKSVQEGVTHSVIPLISASKSATSARRIHVFYHNKENIAINNAKEPEPIIGVKVPTTETGTPLEKKSLGWLRKQFKRTVEEEKKRKALQSVSDNCLTAGDLAKET
ncbi:hypothetical protein Ancab_009589 [Ancistrocladus abbreviatus]